jgi:Xaa-Pro aminopeptidase
MHRTRIDTLRAAHPDGPILLTDPNSLYYYCDFVTPGASRTVLLFDWPGSDAPRLFVRDMESTNFTRHDLGVVIVPYQEENPISEVARLLPQSGVAHAELSALTVRELKLLPPKLEWVDITAAARLVRTLKTPEEVECVRRAAAFVHVGQMHALRNLRPGLKETDVAAFVSYAKMREGSEWVAYPEFVASGPNGCKGHHAASSSKTLREGELLFIETGASHRRYHAARMHTVWLGTPPVWFARMERGIRAALERGQAMCAAGARAYDVDLAMRQMVEAIDCPHRFRMSRRSGYSIGIGNSTDWSDQSVFLNPTSSHTLQENMVLHLIPWVQVEGCGAVGFSDTVVVGAQRPVSLFPAALPCLTNWATSEA